MSAKLSPRQRGDFQTPEALAKQVWETLDANVDLIVEPTFGLGSFLSTLPARDSRVIGWEIDEDYYRNTNSRLGNMKLILGDVFLVSREDLPITADSKVLVVGNPPWVTNSEQSSLGGLNTGSKKNLKSLTGLAAKTGKANFDISEAIILHLVNLLYNVKVAQFALLGKFTVVRNLIEFLGANPHIGDFEFHRIDAKKHFGAAVDAGLIKFKVGTRVHGSSVCRIFNSIGGEETGEIGVYDGKFVYDVHVYEKMKFLERQHESDSFYVWRQGIKHDLQDVLELQERDGVLTNKLGEKVVIENQTIHHLYKSSDIFHGRCPRFLIPLYQRDLKDMLFDLPTRYPQLYAYLKAHEDKFVSRKSSIYKNRTPFTVFGIGDYTYSYFKVAIGALYNEPVFRILKPDVYPVAIDDTSYALSTNDYAEAMYLQAILNLTCTREFLKSISREGDKRRFSKEVLSRVFIPPFSRMPLAARSNLTDSARLTDWLRSDARDQQQLFSP